MLSESCLLHYILCLEFLESLADKLRGSFRRFCQKLYTCKIFKNILKSS